MSDTDELQYHVDLLMRAGEDGAFLVISIPGTDDFLQLTGDAHGVQIDFPLITDRQIRLESKIHLTAEREKLPVVMNEGGTGDRFLDIEMEKDATEVARLCRVLLRDVFGVSEGTQLEFEAEFLS